MKGALGRVDRARKTECLRPSKKRLRTLPHIQSDLPDLPPSGYVPAYTHPSQTQVLTFPDPSLTPSGWFRSKLGLWKPGYLLPQLGEELMTTPILQATEALSPEAEASTALIAVVIAVVFLTLLSVVVLIFFYLYKNKGTYVTYEPAGGEPSTILQMESDSVKGREKEEYFI
ncbi:PREDICTED: small cell adhesion glycoprotein [Chrysochloris asiatica]|uniref:Small cell adhesion glycoprotein n=1 Tax=Chrysochloris asiatica TaxID=185453 RepID=A0A9B0WW67_CHRAS|nr:PREDICTED: small cell adhesion glycoprotein [Chrysochloris asiatica]